MATTYALLIGIEDYSQLDQSTGNPQGTNDLRGACNDIHAMAMLTRTMDIPADNIRVLTNPLMGPNDFDAAALALRPTQNMNMVDATFGYASRQSILDGIAWLSERLAGSAGAQGILYFSGHSLLTRHGHPCLAPADTVLSAPRAVPFDPAEPDAVGRYVRLTAGLGPLTTLLGTEDVDALLHFLERLYEQQEHLSEPDWILHCAAEINPDVTPQAAVRFVDTLGAVGPEWLRTLPDHIRDPDEVSSLISGDPLAEAAQFSNLISFNKAFYAALRDVPPGSNVHVLLETCMEGRKNDYYRHHGLPLVHRNVVMLSSCHIGQSSERAVFSNRWSGAFTWALGSLLSQTPVLLTRQGRCFDTTYAALGEKLGQLLHLTGFAQKPGLWTQPAQAQWQVFGTTAGEWTVDDALKPRRVREEVEAGTTGQIYKVVEENGSTGSPAIGWLILTPGAAPSGWTPNREYWQWSSTDHLEQGLSFKLVCPDPGYSGATLADWISHLGLSPGNVSMEYNSKNFISGNPPQPLNGHFRINKNGTDIAAMKQAGSKLVWQRPGGSGPRLLFAPGHQIVLSPGQEIVFSHTPGPVPPSLMGMKVEDDIILND